MKYWRGYLVAVILGAITWGLTRLAAEYSTLVDMVYPYLTRTVQNFLAGWSGGVDFCVWQVAVVLLILLVVATIVLMIVLRWNFFQWLGWVLTGVVTIYFAHTCVYGLNYHAGPLADDIRLEVTDYTLDELQDATIYYRDLANKLADQVSRDGSGDVIFPSFHELAEQAGDGFETLTYEKSYSVFAGSTLPVKELGWAEMYTSMGITGVSMGLTGEAAVNPQTPAVGLPFTMSHEMAHRMCIAIERDANFAAFLACSNNSSVEFQYSAYFMAYRYCYYALASQGSAEAATAAARIATGVNENLKHDWNTYGQFFADHQDEGATRFADIANDTYLKTSGDEDGIASYDEVSSLLVCWHIQEVVLPAQQQEAESTFDPYDENQVDLNGIVGALKGN
ncbi:MAG: DUF3810 domain-containing protein [Oscillospiraceae bacterium]|nr:DUF3810 domain-containing protein [Oscillospiraceae bacterium]